MNKFTLFSRQLRPFSTSRHRQQQFLIIAQDFADAETLGRRIDARPAHLNAVEDAVEKKSFLWGGAMLHAGKPVGSALLLQADSVEEVRKLIKDDPYIEGRVWDPDKIQIIPFKTAVNAYEQNAKLQE